MFDPLCFIHMCTIFIINFYYNQNFLLKDNVWKFLFIIYSIIEKTQNEKCWYFYEFLFHYLRRRTPANVLHIFQLHGKVRLSRIKLSSVRIDFFFPSLLHLLHVTFFISNWILKNNHYSKLIKYFALKLRKLNFIQHHNCLFWLLKLPIN